MQIDHLLLSLSIVTISASNKESTCFFIAGKDHSSSVSSALIEIHCLLKSRYLMMSVFVLLQINFSIFIVVIFFCKVLAGFLKVVSIDQSFQLLIFNLRYIFL